jgi:DNA-binding protein H-NS
MIAMSTKTYKELIAQRTELEAQIDAARKQELSDVVAQIRGLVQEYDLTAQDIFTARRTSTTSVAPKFRDPETGKTWTGRGKEPTWIKGKDRSQYAIA